MRRKFRLVGFVLLGIAALVAAFMLGTYSAIRHVPEFYERALAAEPQKQRQASEELSSRVTMLYSDARREGDWKAIFTQQQINGWLAVDLIEKHGEMLPPNIHDPRVEITAEGITLALRIEDESIDTVFSLTVEPYLAEPNVVAFRLRKARAGALPMPLSEVLAYVTDAAKEVELPLRWTSIDDDPVALLTIAPQRDRDDNVLQIDVLELRDQEVYFAGRTMPGSEAPSLDNGSVLPARFAAEFYNRDNRQR